MTPALAQEKSYTIDDIYNLPEGSRAELIDGQIYYMAPPSTKHQRILSFLHLEIGNYIRARNGECEVFPAPFAVFLFADDSKYLEPDISVVCDKNKLNDHGCNGAPDWVIEIVSPSSLWLSVFGYHWKKQGALASSKIRSRTLGEGGTVASFQSSFRYPAESLIPQLHISCDAAWYGFIPLIYSFIATPF